MEDPIITVRGVRFQPRMNTTDAKAIKEVVVDRCYTPHTLPMLPGDTVLDLGANVGAFAVYAAVLDCKVIAYEPVAANLEALRRNAALNDIPPAQLELHEAVVLADPGDGSALLATPSRLDNQYRYTTLPRKGWETHPVPAVSFAAAVAAARPHGIKIDIEGAEIAIIDQLEAQPELLAGVEYIVGEYHFDWDSDMPRFFHRMGVLAGIFSHKRHRNTPPEGQWQRWPGATPFRFWNDRFLPKLG